MFTQMIYKSEMMFFRKVRLKIEILIFTYASSNTRNKLCLDNFGYYHQMYRYYMPM